MQKSGLMTVGFVTAYALFNLQPYLGLRYRSCQTMYSGLSPVAPSNHLFLPILGWSDIGEYLENAQIGSEPPHRYLNREAARWQIRERCAAGKHPSLSFERAGHTQHIADACAQPEYSSPRHNVFAHFGYPPSLGDTE
jgi:hypothetical protein